MPIIFLLSPKDPTSFVKVPCPPSSHGPGISSAAKWQASLSWREDIYIYISFKKSDSLRKNTTILQLYEAHIDEIYHSLTQKTWYLLLFAFEIKSKFRPGWYSGLDTKVNEWLWSGIHYMFLYLCHSPITELDDVNIFGKPPIFWWQKQWFPVDCPTNPMNQPICFLMSDIHQFLRIVISATASLKLAYVQELQAPRFLFQNET